MRTYVDVRAALNQQKRDMLKRGTTYRKRTAVLSSRLSNDLVSLGHVVLTRQELVEFLKHNYKVDVERANDVAKNVDVYMKSANDRVRLAHYYQKADQLLNNKH